VVFGRGSNSDNKSEGPKPITLAAVGAQAPPAAPEPAAPGLEARSPFAPAARMTASVIGTDLAIVGERITIISQHALQIDGDIRADINGRAVVIGEEGSVVGTISAETVDVRGGVRGAIRGRSVTLRSSAQVEGEITHETLTIAEGANFDGRVRRAKNPQDLAVELDASAIAARLPQQGAA
jgi:cytoskeletal protein CcmA (bactofilin family)